MALLAALQSERLSGEEYDVFRRVMLLLRNSTLNTPTQYAIVGRKSNYVNGDVMTRLGSGSSRWKKVVLKWLQIELTAIKVSPSLVLDSNSC